MSPSRSRSRRRSSSAGWAWVVVAVATGVIGVLLTYHLVRNRIRDKQRHTFETLITEAEADDRAGTLDRALDRLTTALTLARAQGLADSTRLEALELRRAELETRRETTLRETIETQSASDLEAARDALSGSRPEYVRAIELCEAAYGAARDVPTPSAGEISRAAHALASSLVRERGVGLTEPTGTFLDPSRGPATYIERVRPILVAHLEGRGYLPDRPGSPLAELWPSHASRRLTIRVEERKEGDYMESVLRTSRLDLKLDLEQAGQVLWHARTSAKTREPSPRIPHSASAAFATARKRDPAAEKRLYDDAVDNLTGLLPARLATLPECVVGSPGGR